MLLKYLWKWIVSLIAGFGLLTIAISFASTLPDNYVCIELYDGSTSSSDNRYVVDTNRGFYQHDTRYDGVEDGGIYSPDRTAYIYVQSIRQYKKGSSNLYIRSVKTNTSIPLETDLFPSYSNSGITNYVRWSADSQRVAYLWTGMDKQVHLSITDADGTNKQTVVISSGDAKLFTINNLLLSAWSADRKYLAIAVRGQGETGFWFWSTQSLQRLPSEFDNQALTRGVWSPDGHTFAGVLPGKQPQFVLITPGHTFAIIKSALSAGSYEQVSWSPDGHYLVLSAVVENCTEDSCPLYWRHYLFDAHGKSVTDGLWGNQSKSLGDASFITGSGGSISLTQHTLTGLWRSQGHTWVFVQEEHPGDTENINLVALDAETGDYETLASHLVVYYVDDIFYNLTDYVFAPISFDAIPLVPGQFHNAIVPRWEDGKINVELINVDGEGHKLLVAGADDLTRSGTYWLGSAFWRSSKFAFVTWVQGQGAERQVRLSIVNPESRMSQEMPLDFQDIGQLQWLTPSWTAFVGEKDNTFNVYAFNIQTGAYRELLHDLISMTSQWSVQIDQHEQVAIAGYFPRSDTHSRIVLVRLTDSDSQIGELGSDGLPIGYWSPDGLTFAFITGAASPSRRLRMVTQEGTPVAEIALRPPLYTQPWINNWTKCY